MKTKCLIKSVSTKVALQLSQLCTKVNYAQYMFDNVQLSNRGPDGIFLFTGQNIIFHCQIMFARDPIGAPTHFVTSNNYPSQTPGTAKLLCEKPKVMNAQVRVFSTLQWPKSTLNIISQSSKRSKAVWTGI